MRVGIPKVGDPNEIVGLGYFRSMNDKEVDTLFRGMEEFIGKLIEEGDFYLAHEEMVETIQSVLKWARLDTPPKRAEHTATTIRVS